MKLIQKNKLAYFNYKILEKFEAGIVLTGAEVKSVKKGQIDLKGSYVTIHNNEAWLINAHISPYKMASSQKDYDPTRARKLLLKQKEIKSLIGKEKAQGLTIVPISVYIIRRLVKIKLGLARGKKKADKRESIKKRDVNRKIRRAMRQKV